MPDSTPRSPSSPDGEAVTYSGARAPDRTRRVDSSGLSIAVYEWGKASAPPLLLAHGGLDFARTFDVFAPKLADAGWRVVSWDHRGHGDSAHSHLYSWDADVRDTLAVLESTSQEPLVAVGHSKGSGLLVNLIQALPERFLRYVSIEGLPGNRPRPDVTEHEWVDALGEMTSAWLDQRRRTAGRVRRPDTLDGLAKRRGRMNPRMDHPWLRYLVSVGARHDSDSWRWKIDPTLGMGGVGPWRPSWSLRWLPQFPVPLLGILGRVDEPMSMGATAENLASHLPPGARVDTLDVGHFAHIEQPDQVAEMTLEWLA